VFNQALVARRCPSQQKGSGGHCRRRHAGGGIIGTIAVERIRTSDAKKAREEVRQQERDDFQRTTLLELQEILGQYVRAVGKVRVPDERARAATGQWHGTQLPADVSSKAFESGRRARQLVLRVRDDILRERFDAFHKAAISVELLDPTGDPEMQMVSLRERLRELEDRLGVNVRKYL